MTRRLPPAFALAAALIIMALVGGRLLQSPRCIVLSERDRTSYGLMPKWRAQFDALSAVCGAGLLLHDLGEEYTPLGRWVLAALGIGGALTYLIAARAAVARLYEGNALPPARAVALAYAGGLGVAIVVALVAARFPSARVTSGDAVWNAVSAFSSLGWLYPFSGAASRTPFVGLAALGALGWPLWIGVVKRGRLLRAAAWTLVTYAVFLLLCTVAVALLETPRAVPPGRGEARPAAGSSFSARLMRSGLQVVAASGAGMSTEKLSDRAVSEGTKAVLAVVVLVGAPGGSPGGGAKWSVALWVVAAGVALARGAAPLDERRSRAVQAAVATLLTMALLTLVTALGLLAIEGCTASAFQIAPTFADACLDAASAVAGGNLSTGLVAAVTSANLSRGIRQSVDLYQYGMIWLMAAMLVGRVAPVLILGRCAGVRVREGPTRLPPPLI